MMHRKDNPIARHQFTTSTDTRRSTRTTSTCPCLARYTVRCPKMASRAGTECRRQPMFKKGRSAQTSETGDILATLWRTIRPLELLPERHAVQKLEPCCARRRRRCRISRVEQSDLTSSTRGNSVIVGRKEATDKCAKPEGAPKKIDTLNRAAGSLGQAFVCHETRFLGKRKVRCFGGIL